MDETAIKVVLRIRPGASESTAAGGNRQVVNCVDRQMLVLAARGAQRDQTFCYDEVFGQSATQAELFTTCGAPMIDNIINGYNSTIFAYGATGCGKTHTVNGAPEDPGLVKRCIDLLYEKMAALKLEREFCLKVSYLEVYNEKIRDLLNDTQRALTIRQDRSGIKVSNLTVHEPASSDEVMRLIAAGNLQRSVASTAANAQSSRSHAVLEVVVEQAMHSSGLEQQMRRSRLCFIDLAGSERASATLNRGSQLKEGGHINKSLLALGKCINALCTKSQFVPFRESNLTRLLQPSLADNCKTLMVACVSPLACHYDDTLNTLTYASRASQIKTRSVRNHLSAKSKVTDYVSRIERQANVIAEHEAMHRRRDKRDEACKEIAELALARQYAEALELCRERSVGVWLEKLIVRMRGDDEPRSAKRARAYDATPSRLRTPDRAPFTPSNFRVPPSVRRGNESPFEDGSTPSSFFN